MSLSALIKGKGKGVILHPAKANTAKVAKVAGNATEIEPILAGLATLALAAPATLPPLMEQPEAPRQVQPPGNRASPLAPPPVEITRAGIVYATPPRCFNCKGQDLWRSRHGVTVCRRCHPPAPGAETAKGQA